jgi:hypothetical protein
MNKLIGLGRLFLVLGLFTLVAYTLRNIGCSSWYNVKVEVTYQHGEKEIFEIQVATDTSRIQITEGEIEYQRANIHKTNSGISVSTSWVTLASSAKHFRILSSVKHVINEGN